MKINFDIIRKHKTVAENAIALSLLNAFNMLLPLINLPYLIRTVGLSNYGAYAIVYAVIEYALLFSAYGFNFSSTKEISQNRDDTEKISKIVNSTICARAIISLVTLALIGIFVYLYYPSNYFIAFVFGIGIIIGDILNPIWLYQGMEKMKYMTIVNFICKLLFTLLIFVFIKEQGDWLYITFLYSIGYLTSGIISLVIAFKIFHIQFVHVTLQNILFQIKEGWNVFLSTFFITAYRNSNVFLLGFFVPEYSVGIYASAEKVVKAVQSIVSPISNAIFPYMSLSFKGCTLQEGAKKIMLMCKKLSPFILILMLALILTTKLISIILLGNVNTTFIKIVILLSPIVYFGVLNYILGFVGLVNLSYSKSFLKAVIISGVGSVSILLCFVKFVDIYSGVMAMLSAEIVLFFLCLKKIFKMSNK